MNIHDHYNDLLHLLDLSGYPCKHLDGRAVVQYVDDGTGDTWDTEQVADCCDYLTGILVAHMEQLDHPSPSIREAINNLIGQVGEDETNGRIVDEGMLKDCDAITEWMGTTPPNSGGSPMASWDRSRLESLVKHFVHCCHEGDTACCETADNLYPELFPQDDEQHKDTQADVDQAIRRLKEIQARSKGGAA